MANFTRPPVQLNPLTIIVGEEDLIAIETQDAIRGEAAKRGFTERVSFNFDGNSDYSPLLLSMGDMSLFGEKKLIEVRLMTGNPGLKKGPEALLEMAQSVGDDLIAVLTLPGALWEYQKKAWFKKITPYAKIVNAAPVSRSALPGWIKQRALQNGQKLSNDAVNFIAASTEGNLLACAQEINKLALLSDKEVIDYSDLVDAISDTSRFSPPDLSDAILAGDAPRVSKIIDGLKGENVQIPAFLWMLNDDIRNMIAINRGANPYIPFPTKKAQLTRLAHAVPLSRLETVAQRYSNVERLSKGFKISSSIEDAWQELKAAALLLCIKRK